MRTNSVRAKVYVSRKKKRVRGQRAHDRHGPREKYPIRVSRFEELDCSYFEEVGNIYGENVSSSYDEKMGKKRVTGEEEKWGNMENIQR